MNAKTTYALILAFAGIAIQLINFLLGFETNKAGTPGATIFSAITGLLSLILLFMLLWFGVRAVRDEKPDQCLTYGQGVGAGVMITLIAGIIGAIYCYIHYSFINPDFAENLLTMMRQQWAEKGLDESNPSFEMLEKWTRMSLHPASMAAMTFLTKMFFGTICSLIAAAIVKRNPQPGAAMPPPIQGT